MVNEFKYRVSFDEADGEGIVFFGNYFRLAHRAFEDFMPALGIPWHEWFKNDIWAVPLRHVECDYQRPLIPGQMIVVKINVESIGESSAHFVYEIRDLDSGAVCAKLKTSHVFVTRPKNAMKKFRIPDEIRKRLEPALLKQNG
jgi:YbgC/YbaW family acyl-CoA thioester hydrolase